MGMANVHRAGPVVEAKSKDFHWLEWSLGEQHELDNLKAVLRCNPAPWIGQGDLRRQQRSVSEAAFAQFHACRWGIKEAAWLPEGAWANCRGEVQYRVHGLVERNLAPSSVQRDLANLSGIFDPGKA